MVLVVAMASQILGLLITSLPYSHQVLLTHQPLAQEQVAGLCCTQVDRIQI